MSEPKNYSVVQGGNFKELYKKKFGTVLAKNRAMTPEQLIIMWKREEEYSEVMEFVESVINEQKFQLAANGVINASFIGKDLGIDKPASINIENSSASASTVVATTEDAMKEAVNSILDML